jgi:tetratricopeptide (TPR) repeat protein
MSALEPQPDPPSDPSPDPPPDAPPQADGARFTWRRTAFRSGIGIFALACCLGLAHSLLREGRPPSIAQEYGPFVRQLLAERQYERAVRELRAALRLDHTLSKTEAQFVLAHALAQSGQFDAAIAGYRAVLAMEPDHAAARAELGGTFAARGDFDAAVREMRRALEIDPELAGIPARLAWAEGCALRRRGRLDEAVGRFRTALLHEPTLADARYDLGVTLAAGGRLDDAARELRELVRTRPDARGYNALGLALAQAGRADEAATAFRDGLALAPGDTELQRNLSRMGQR